MIPIPIVFLGVAFYTVPFLLEAIQPNPLTIILKEDPELRQSIIQFIISSVYTYGLILGGWLLGLITHELIWQTQYKIGQYKMRREVE